MHQPTSQLVIFTLAGGEYALRIERVREIIRHEPPRAILSTEPSIVGIVSVRGLVIPVCDLRVRLGLGEPLDPSERKIVIIETVGERTVGLLVDQVAEVLTVEADVFGPVPTATADVIPQVAQIGERLVLIIDTDELDAALELDERHAAPAA